VPPFWRIVYSISLFPNKSIIQVKSPEADRLIQSYLEKFAFEPDMKFTQTYSISPESLIPWSALFEWIPRRVAWWASYLEQAIPTP
jgi:hypothetical protein